MRCTDSPSRNKVENRRFDAAFCEVCSVFEASEKMPWAYSQLCLVWASFSRCTTVAVYKTEYIRQKNEWFKSTNRVWSAVSHPFLVLV